MKKVLFATTALIATAGVAAADITFGGFGRFGLFYDEGATGTAKETRLEQRFRLTITGLTESDAGVKFEGRFRLESNENADGGAGGAGPGAAGFAVSSGGFRLDVGHVSDVVDSGDVVSLNGISVGLTGFIETNDAATGFDKNGFGVGDVTRQTVKARYQVGDFTVAASYTEENEATAEDSYVQFGLGYDFANGMRVGAAYGQRDNAAEEDYWAASLRGSAGALAYHAVVGDSDAQDDLFYGLSFSYDVSSATQLRAVIADGGADADGDETVFGVGFKHSLGGGVSLQGGVGQEDDGDTQADLGVRFDF
ncbi:porin [Epibacterium ulvae]|uniref:porin n=1 Tax=Epibacterium ulvae TaxID=1156985 RepID=UPI001BFC8A76|nr:porin [Epibacterium ulvae]MBT8153495.1 porin [Epibacterium ulvae]